MRWMRSLLLIVVLLASACGTDPTPELTVDDITIQVQVDPDPPTVGEAQLTITLADSAGRTVDGAAVHVRGDRAGQLPVDVEATGSENGVYHLPFSWTNAGHWILGVTVTLPDDQGVLEDTAVFFVNAAPLDDVAYTNDSGEQVDPSRELRIIIPEGTTEMLRAGQDPGLITGDIVLKLSEQHVLIIENHDSFAHMVGPFFIGVGESVRQTFTRPAIYEGGCSIHEDEQVRIVVQQ